MSQGATQAQLDHLFRHEAGRMVSALSRLFGMEGLAEAEDIVQETLLKAAEVWPYQGLPDNPAAWLHRVARNKALDRLRSQKRHLGAEDRVGDSLYGDHQLGASVDEVFLEDELRDSQLRMMFALCHPSLPIYTQVPLILQVLGGFSNAEIARAFYESEETVRKRTYRAKQTLREAHSELVVPTGDELHRRLEAVRSAIYLLFNEGYRATSGEVLVREELVREAIRLGQLLTTHKQTADGATYGLLSLLAFQTSRLRARVDAQGASVLLEDQDRSQWDQHLIAEGQTLLVRALSSGVTGRYQLQAAIDSCHCVAEDFAQTDWKTILLLYDRLLELEESSVVRLHRVVALSFVEGPQVALTELEQLGEPMRRTPHFPAIQADLLARLGRKTEAKPLLEEAIARCELEPERKALQRKFHLLG